MSAGTRDYRPDPTDRQRPRSRDYTRDELREMAARHLKGDRLQRRITRSAFALAGIILYTALIYAGYIALERNDYPAPARPEAHRAIT